MDDGGRGRTAPITTEPFLGTEPYEVISKVRQNLAEKRLLMSWKWSVFGGYPQGNHRKRSICRSQQEISAIFEDF